RGEPPRGMLPGMSKSALTARQRLEFRIARIVAALPPRLQVWLSRRPPVVVDGQTLEPEIQLTLALLERQGNPPIEPMTAALAGAAAHAEGLGADPRRVAVGGDSAGGNLAAVTSWLAAHDGGPSPCFQLLIYPAADASREYPSQELFRDGFFLTQSEMDWF